MKSKITWFRAAVLLVLAFVPAGVRGADSLYLGVAGGYVGVSGSAYQSGLGFGADLGFGVNPLMDLVLRTQASSHDGSGGATVWAHTMSADFHVGNLYDVDVAVGAGPGLYKFASSYRFGLHGELITDVVMDSLRVGLAWRYHGLFSPASTESNIWSVMARFGVRLEI